MKKVKDVLPIKEYILKSKDILEKEIGHSVRKNIANLSSFYKMSQKPWFNWMIGVFFTLPIIGFAIVIGVSKINSGFSEFLFAFFGLLFISAIVLLFGQQKAKLSARNMLASSIDYEIIYKTLFTNLPNVEYLKYNNINNGSLRKFRISEIPSDARVVQFSPIIHFKVGLNIIGMVQIGNMCWKRTVGKTTSTYYRATSYITLKSNKNLETNFSYSIRPKGLFNNNKKYNLESSAFNKAFHFEFNDEIKARMIYTPLTMEKTVAHAKKIWTSIWVMSKTKDQFLFKFSPTSKEQLSISGKIYPNDMQKTIDSFVKDIIHDGYNFYLILHLALIPPMI